MNTTFEMTKHVLWVVLPVNHTNLCWCSIRLSPRPPWQVWEFLKQVAQVKKWGPTASYRADQSWLWTYNWLMSTVFSLTEEMSMGGFLQVVLGNPLVAQWLGLPPSLQGVGVQSLVRELRSWKLRGTAKKKKKLF